MFAVSGCGRPATMGGADNRPAVRSTDPSTRPNEHEHRSGVAVHRAPPAARYCPFVATGAALGLTRGIDVGQATATPDAGGLVGGIVLLVVVFVAYFCGGYVAGRMARFHGARQGVGVWLWAVIIAVVIAILGLIAGTQFDVLARLNGFPRIPLNEGTLTTGGILTAIGVAVVSLAGATVGGLSGMRFHRRVDSVVESAAR